jgi:hypothetical protein
MTVSEGTDLSKNINNSKIYTWFIAMTPFHYKTKTFPCKAIFAVKKVSQGERVAAIAGTGMCMGHTSIRSIIWEFFGHVGFGAEAMPFDGEFVS